MKSISIIYLFTLFISFSVFSDNNKKENNISIQQYYIQGSIDDNITNISIKATISLLIPEGNDKISLTFNKDVSIKSIIFNQKDIEYTFDKEGETPNIFVDDGRLLSLLVKNKKNDLNELEVNYEVPIESVNYITKRDKNNTLEMGLYKAWYPLNIEYGKFDFQLELTLPDTYNLTGNGKIENYKNMWSVSSRKPGIDIVVITGRELKKYSFDVGNASVNIVNIGTDKETFSRLLADTKQLIPFYQKKLGSPSRTTTHYRFVFVPRKTGPSYSRDGFAVVTQFKEGQYQKLIKTIGHEIGHFWWNNAPADTWEDWLNESFAEYTALLGIEMLNGSVEKESILKKYKNETKQSIAIKGLDRNNSKAYKALYRKGPLILENLKIKIGEDKFFELLRIIIKEKVNSTEKLKAIITRQNNQSISSWLEKQLSSKSMLD